MPNQTYANGTGPAAALEGTFEDVLSFLPGQRYPACTCPGEDHPGPSNDIGRSAPEVDLIEATVSLVCHSRTHFLPCLAANTIHIKELFIVNAGDRTDL